MKKTKGFTLTRRAFAYPYVLFLLLFVVVPLVLILLNAFWVDGALSLDNFVEFFSDVTGLKVLENSLIIGFATTLLCLLFFVQVSRIKQSLRFVVHFAHLGKLSYKNLVHKSHFLGTWH